MKINAVEFNNVFSIDELKTLNNFLFEVDRCNQSKIIKNKKINLNQTISFKENKVSITHSLIEEDDLHSFLHKIRPFILEKENLYFMTIKNLIGKRFNFDVLNKYLKELNNKYITKNDYNSNLIIDEKKMPFEKIFTYYLNSLHYHREEKKKLIIDKIIELHGNIELFEFKMMNILLIKYNAIQELAYIVDKIIKDEDITL
ncbi:hypothetical protein [Candidatus Marinarcus aquaticus]|uniref:Uncharacterized protein n=1 Tax=Candidatus Marinarcus aquaticus TaxID=2044504 RepID=A0A4Q0XQ37_9BACT|nr:hypothetical protein [Candidatus Marinarcus aquaticus]RXJ57708.1 hypothetical protein CRV04_07815 [Candidatus Marinarcus aquaticus]